MKKLTNKLVVLDLGMHPKNIGKLSMVKDGIIEW